MEGILVGLAVPMVVGLVVVDYLSILFQEKEERNRVVEELWVVLQLVV